MISNAIFDADETLSTARTRTSGGRGCDRSTAQQIIAEAEATCPCSKAVAGNVPVAINQV